MCDAQTDFASSRTRARTWRSTWSRRIRLRSSSRALAIDQALAEASRCLYCYDAPCTRACPTHIDVPAFIKKIATGNLRGSARTILVVERARRLVRARLPDGGAVRGRVRDARRAAEADQIGQLQRYATDWAMAHGMRPFEPGPRRAGRVAIIGAGPAGLACAAELLRLGVRAADLRRRRAAGRAQHLGRRRVQDDRASSRCARSAGSSRRASRSRAACASASTCSSPTSSASSTRCSSAWAWARWASSAFPARSSRASTRRSSSSRSSRCGAPRRAWASSVVVIGGGNTSIDVVTQAHALGAEEVTLVYRRSADEMPAYKHEVELARASGCRFVFQAAPLRIVGARASRRSCCSRCGSARPTRRGVASPSRRRASR